MRVLTSPLVLCLAAAICLNCSGGTSSQPAPTLSPAPGAPSPTPTVDAPTPAVPADVAGKWIGTIESANFATRTISALAFQSGTCVDGAWGTEPKEWAGAISGDAGVKSFTGSISFERPADGPGKCGGIATFSGEVGADTIRWTSTGFTGECAGGFPQAVTITLRRQ